jgi:hypothetical protein
MILIPTDMSAYGDAYYPEFDPLVIIDENGLYPELREKVLASLENSVSNPSTVYDVSKKDPKSKAIPSKVDENYRTSFACIIDPEIYELLAIRFDEVVAWQMRQHGIEKQFKLDESIQALKYTGEKKSRFASHTDNAFYDASGKFNYTNPNRVISLISYVNDDFEGGELVFKNLLVDKKPFVYKPKAGDTVIFPSDLRYPHEVKPVTKGTRYSIVAWYGLV